MNDLEKLRSAAAENPAVLLFLGACPAMGASSDLRGALALGLTVLVISLLSSVIISALRRFLTDWALFWAVVIVSAGLASMAQLLIEAYAPAVYPSIALYVAVCAVNLMVFFQAQAGIGESLKGSLLFLAAVLLTALIRETLGAGLIWGREIPGLAEYRIPLLAKAPGGFIVLSMVLAMMNVCFLRPVKENK